MIQFHDISYAQGAYNMDADNCPVIFMKASGFYYGSKTPYPDEQCNRNYNNAKRLGKIPGLYHFAGGADPIAEADYFVKCAAPEDGDILILDYELTAVQNPPADPSAWCLAFVERVHELTGTYPLFYTYFAMLQQYGFKEVLKRCGLWIAHYGISPEVDIPGCPPYIIHQFQSSPLDTNALFISLDTLKKYAFRPTVELPPPVEPPVVVPPVVVEPDVPPVVPTPEPTPKVGATLWDVVWDAIQKVIKFLKGYKKS